MRTWGMLLGAALVFMGAIGWSAPAGKSLVDRNLTMMFLRTLPEHPHGFGVPLANRTLCDSADFQNRYKEMVKQANSIIAKPLPPWSNEDYELFFKTGDRNVGQKMMGRRHVVLMTCVLAECVENKGRFLPYILNALTEYCSDTWTLPAHDANMKNYQRKGFSIDLNSSAFAFTLAETLYILGDKVPPELRAKVMAELDLRIFQPIKKALVLDARGRSSEWWTICDHNWNSVCWNGVVGTVLAVHPDKVFRAEIASAAMNMAKRYFEGFPADGYCVEGTGYWNYGFSNYLGMREIIWQATRGEVELMNDPKVIQVMLYGLRIQTLNQLSPALGDCAFGARPNQQLVDYCNQVLGLNLPTTTVYTRDPFSAPLFFTGAKQIIPFSVAKPIKMESPPKERPYSSYFHAATVLISRSKDMTFSAAIKAGGNGNHSHNDIGSYVIVCNTDQPCGDPGGPAVYIRETFSSKRYTHPILNAHGHPVPVVAGKEQLEAHTVKPKVIACETSDEKDRMVIDMRAAYAVPQMSKLERSYEFDHIAKTVKIEDAFAYTEPSAFEGVLITRGTFKQVDEKTFLFAMGKSTVRATIEASAPYTVTTEAIDDHNVKFTRIGLVFTKPALEGFVKVQYSPCEKH